MTDDNEPMPAPIRPGQTIDAFAAGDHVEFYNPYFPGKRPTRHRITSITQPTDKYPAGIMLDTSLGALPETIVKARTFIFYASEPQPVTLSPADRAHIATWLKLASLCSACGSWKEQHGSSDTTVHTLCPANAPHRGDRRKRSDFTPAVDLQLVERMLADSAPLTSLPDIA